MSKKDKTNTAVSARDQYTETNTKRIVGANLKKIQEALDFTQRHFAKLLDISASTLNGHINGETFPSIGTLVSLLTLQDLKEKNIFFSLDDLILNPDFDPLIQATFGEKRLKASSTYKTHRDFLGTYVTYSYDRSNNETSKNGRELRYGVINVYENYSATGEETFAVMGRFFKEENKERAFSLKENIDNLYTKDLSKANLLQNVKELMMDNGDLYTGLLSFGDGHAFFSLDNREYNDRALIILHVPNKRGDKDYIGGLGCVSSVTRGRHMPSAQKIIISKYAINKSREEIASHLRMLSQNFVTRDITHEMIQLDKRLYSVSAGSDTVSQFLSERDKQAIFDSRLHQLISNFIMENAFCVATVSEMDDRDVYTLIKKFM